jgi:hypothetical protein
MTTFSRVSLVSDRAVVVAVVIAAMLRVLFFVGLFPLFNNVDEVAHIDLVIKRETGLPTGADEPYAMATRDLIFRFGYGAGLAHDGREIRLYLSPQFVDPIPESGDAPIPVWLAPDSVQKAVEPVAQAVWSTRRNHEATELPLYYAIAARWARLGERLGFRQAQLLYWVRGLDVAIVGLLVALAGAFGRLFDPANRVFCLGLPILVAAFPQKVFYSITNDALSPLVGGLAIYGGLRLIASPRAHTRDALFAGTMVALAILTKLTNVFVIVMIPALVALRLRRAGPADASRAAAWLILGATAPLAIWRIAAGPSAFHAGDKAAALGWTYRPLAELLDHPIFTVPGAWHFVSQLLKTFWRGEFSWHGVPLALPAMDAAFVACSLVLLGVAGLRLLRETRPDPQRAMLVSLLIFTSGVLMLAGLSLIFDFGAFSYPSRALPFFTSGRLIGAALLPFAALFVYGLETLLARTALRGHGVLVVFDLALVVTVVELTLSMDAIGSPYNWFHLR